MTGPEMSRQVEVCWKHEEGDLDLDQLDLEASAD